MQVTFLKCGGVSLSVRIHHILGDGYACLQFLNTWSAVAGGTNVTEPPYLDRRILRASNIPNPKFRHIEFEQPSPDKNGKINDDQDSPDKNGKRNDGQDLTGIFKITRDQLDRLKAKATEDGNQVKYTTYEMLSGHIWRCLCKARNFNEDQERKMYVAIDSRK